jgi:hypothetical protein
MRFYHPISTHCGASSTLQKREKGETRKWELRVPFFSLVMPFWPLTGPFVFVFQVVYMGFDLSLPSSPLENARKIEGLVTHATFWVFLPDLLGFEAPHRLD